MRTLLERLEWLVEHRAEGNQRELNRRAGLKSNHIGTILTRLRRNPDAQIDHETIAKIAEGGHVSVDWLARGRGAPDGSTQERPVFGSLPGWTEAEAQARAMLPGRPEWVWEAAREVSGMNCPTVADLALVLKAVQLVQDYPPHTAGDTPETTAAKAEIAALAAKEERRLARKRGG